MTKYAPIAILSNNDFLEKWNAWIIRQVASRFKRNKDRIPDVAQDIRLRLLDKDFIGRWFFNHLTDELLDLEQAAKILNVPTNKILFNSNIPIANGVKRGDPQALWRVLDLLNYANFDYYRYYYSIQNHTIDTENFLSLLGYSKTNYNALASLYRQGKIFPSKFTEHNCSGDRRTCAICEKGRQFLSKNNISLSSNWEADSLRPMVRRLRWNDGQLRPYLRHWRNLNRVFCTPEYVMRPVGDKGVDAGLLRYVDIIIANTIANLFKKIGRTDDLESVRNGENVPLNGGKSPVHSNQDITYYESEEDGEDLAPRRAFRDLLSSKAFESIEQKFDSNSLLELADLSDDEISTIKAIELMELTAREYSKVSTMSITRIHRTHSNALRKLRQVAEEPVFDGADHI